VGTNGRLVLRILATILPALLFTPLADAAADLEHAQRWLLQSDAAAAAYRPSGVYQEYNRQRIDLAQARAYALLGDVENTRKRLPQSSGDRPEWQSGGDGAVRSLLVSLDLREINLALLQTLATAGRQADALAYIAALNPEQGQQGLYLALGTALAKAGASPAGKTSGLTDQAQADLRAGFALGLVTMGKEGRARRELKDLDAQLRSDAIERLAATLIFVDDDLTDVTRLLQLAVISAPTSAAIARSAVAMAVREGDLDDAVAVAAFVKEPVSRDALDAQLALGFAARGDTARAAEIFKANPKRTARTWEQVAMLTGQHEWLESYYQALADPWRRSERLYQFARRRLADGYREAGDKLIVIAGEAAEQIPGDSTRWLAFRQLAEYQAYAGAPQAAARWAQRIPASERERNSADIQVSIAWARTGAPDRAREVATSIADPILRVEALSAAAIALPDPRDAAVTALLDSALETLRSIGDDQSRERDAAWGSLTTRLLAAGRNAEAERVAVLAPAGGPLVATSTTMVTHYLAAGNTAAALTWARKLPSGSDTQVGYDRRDYALADVVDTLAAAGETRRAMTVLQEINHPAVRELHTTPVVMALAAQGDLTRALTLVQGLKRGDARESALGLVLYALAQRRELPDPASIMSQVPKRRGSELCWATAAAFGGNDAAAMDGWLQSLAEPACRAFAAAGAAYAAALAPAHPNVDDLFAALDPTHAEERMARAMQIAVAKGR
jgi:hypothetical protein